MEKCVDYKAFGMRDANASFRIAVKSLFYSSLLIIRSVACVPRK
jgi:hypothetical protein